MQLTTTARTAINRACAQVSPRRAAGERNARRILANPDAFPPEMVDDARVTLGEGCSGKA
jgi:hypothetical protein